MNTSKTPEAPDDCYRFAHSLMLAIQHMLANSSEILKTRIAPSDGDVYRASMLFLIDDADIYRITIDSVGDALDLAEEQEVAL